MFWDRRGSRGNRRMPGGRADLFRLVLALAATRPVFTANNVVVLAGKVVDIIDWNDATHVLTQSESGKQCLAPAARASFANQLVCDLDGSAEYTSNRTAAQAAFLQQDGSFLSAVGAPRSTTAGNAPFRIGTKNWAGVAVGFHFDLFNEAGPICRAYANTANGTAVTLFAMLNLADRLVVVIGLKVTLTLQEAPAASAEGQFSVIENHDA